MKLKKVILEIKEIFLTFFWNRKSLIFLILKDFLRLLSFFDSRFEKKRKYFLDRYLKEDRKVIKIKRFGRFIFHLRKGDLHSLREVFVDKDYSLIEEFLPTNGDIVLDLGAGVGDYALLSSVRVGKRGKIISIEVDSQTFELLKMNIIENNLRNVIPLKIFVSYQMERSIDFIVKKLKLKRVDLIKIDIEGEEYNAIRGATRTIRNFKPKIVVEIHSKELKKKILEFLKRYGYNVIFEREKEECGFFLIYFKS